jgi:hypothetical protein
VEAQPPPRVARGRHPPQLLPLLVVVQQPRLNLRPFPLSFNRRLQPPQKPELQPVAIPAPRRRSNGRRLGRGGWGSSSCDDGPVAPEHGLVQVRGAVPRPCQEEERPCRHMGEEVDG